MRRHVFDVGKGTSATTRSSILDAFMDRHSLLAEWAASSAEAAKRKRGGL
jgi:hypothetical protein